MSQVELIVVANGCTDNTRQYLDQLAEQFLRLGFGDHFKIIWSDEPLGYPAATNRGIQAACGQRLVLLNNDVVFLPQSRNEWLSRLNQPFETNRDVGITCSLKLWSSQTKRDFAVFFCVMLDRALVNQVGLLPEVYAVGGAEDIEYCWLAERAGFSVVCVSEHRYDPSVGTNITDFPIWHKAEGTVHDPQLVPNWTSVFNSNLSLLEERVRKAEAVGTTRKFTYSIVIPTYNHCDDLLKPCISSILAYTTMQDVELIVCANGCTDNTRDYLDNLQQQFESMGLADHLQILWSEAALGYSAATNMGIKRARADLIMLLNNDTLLLDQSPNYWLSSLASAFHNDPRCGISCVLRGWSDPAGAHFAVFFCVMIHRKVFDAIGLLNTEYGTGGGEDTEFCIEAERAGFAVVQPLDKTYDESSGFFTGVYPIYHKGEGTMHDPQLVPNWSSIFWQNSVKLSKKYNPAWLAQQGYSATEKTLVGSDSLDWKQTTNTLSWLRHTNKESAELFEEIVVNNVYGIKPSFVKDHLVIDIGANQGIFAILAAHLGASAVVAVEPAALNFKLLQDNVQASACKDRIKTLRAAVLGLRGAPTSLSIQADGSKNSIYTSSSYRELVETKCLEDLIAAEREDLPIFLKMDCEGAEHHIIWHTANWVFERVTHLAVEIHGNMDPNYRGVAQLQERIRSLGFTLIESRPMGMWYPQGDGKSPVFEPMDQTVDLWSRL